MCCCLPVSPFVVKQLYLKRNNTHFAKKVFKKQQQNKASYKNVAMLLVQEHSYTTFFCKFFLSCQKTCGQFVDVSWLLWNQCGMLSKYFYVFLITFLKYFLLLFHNFFSVLVGFNLSLADKVNDLCFSFLWSCRCGIFIF